jgi:MoxR-like ATPase
METIAQARNAVSEVYLSDPVEEYLVRLINHTRKSPGGGDVLDGWLAYGASPRGTIALDICARANAWLQGRDYVTPADIQSIAHDVLRHRLLLSYEAEAEGVTSDIVVDKLLAQVAVP